MNKRQKCRTKSKIIGQRAKRTKSNGQKAKVSDKKQNNRTKSKTDKKQRKKQKFRTKSKINPDKKAKRPKSNGQKAKVSDKKQNYRQKQKRTQSELRTKSISNSSCIFMYAPLTALPRGRMKKKQSNAKRAFRGNKGPPPDLRLKRDGKDQPALFPGLSRRERDHCFGYGLPWARNGSTPFWELGKAEDPKTPYHLFVI
ncbi:Hypothetical predicted protein [Mytilus galloprovincialis]|uniref:Uncharacterized protein n=1 Tax=Mytilus galloprovincialis TaxID=29158 RepID=A0A8B6GU48_MYTGA|nr:Hypothetical predicted protein [Mytilus galloprovincialis]